MNNNSLAKVLLVLSLMLIGRVEAQNTLEAMNIKEAKAEPNKPGQLAILSTKTNLANGQLNGGLAPREIIASELKSSSTLMKREFGILNDTYDAKNGTLQAVLEQSELRPSIPKILGYQTYGTLPAPSEMGVDDEILKTSMAMYQPIHRLQLDFLNDKQARDRYLAQGLTTRGVLLLAMGFLDLTLGSGLKDGQQQTDMNATQELLQQVNWSLERLASPDRAQVFKDTDEKLEACLEIAINQNVAKEQITGLTRKRVNFTCDKNKCGDKPSGSDPYATYNTSNPEEMGNGSYAYCVCCATSETKLNGLGEDNSVTPQGINGADANTWSLVDRAFYGVSKQDQRTRGQSGDALKEFVDIFKDLFGDYLLKEETDGGEKFISSRYATPQVSIQKFVALHKNRCHNTGGFEPKSDLSGSSSADCQLKDEDRFGIKYGICPSIMKIAAKWDQTLEGNPDGEFPRYMAEASMGQPIYGAVMDSIMTMVSNSTNKIEENKESLKVASTIEAFCNTSAVSAVVRHIAFYKNIVNDVLVYNTVISQRDKALVGQLIDRYFEAVRLADLDEQSKFRAYAITQGLNMNRDRQNLQALSSASQAQSNLIANTTNATSLTGFTSSGLFTGNGGAGGGTGGGTGGLARTNGLGFASNLDGKARELMEKSEREALKRDPLKNGALARYAKSIGKSLE